MHFKLTVLVIKIALLIVVSSYIGLRAGQTVNLAGNNEIFVHKHLDLSKKFVLVLEGRMDMWNMEALADKLDESKEVHLVINSPGGSVAAGLKFINRVEALRAQGQLKSLQCYIQDMAASMAAIVSSYCDGVLIHKFGWFMIHEASYGCQGLQSEIKRCVEFSEEYLAQIDEDVASNYGLSVFRYKLFQGTERYMVAQKAVSFGFANAIFDTLYHNGFAPEEPEASGGFVFGGGHGKK